jgi:aryl-alcohol dehydrogenase-like predicted oxidoreductase
METRTFGKTALKVSCLGFGGMELRWLDEPHADSLLNRVLDLGITYIDTSPEYPLSEYYIGQFISKRRDEYVLATKCGDNMTGSGPLYHYTREILLQNLERSLRLMKTDYIDVWQLHAAIPELLPGGSAGEAMETMREAKKAGKVQHLGVTVRNGKGDDFEHPANYGYRSIQEFAGWTDMEVIQLVYGGMTRLSEAAIQKAYDDFGTAIVARGALKGYDNTYPERYEKSGIRSLCADGEGKHGFLLRYALSHPGLSNVLVGTKSIAHLQDNVAAAQKGILPEDIYTEAKRRLNYVGIVTGDPF